MLERIVSRNFLEEYYNASFSLFKDCCGECWCCLRKTKLNELKRNGFHSFNLSVMTWNLKEDLNTLIISPINQNTSFSQIFCNLV